MNRVVICALTPQGRALRETLFQAFPGWEAADLADLPSWFDQVDGAVFIMATGIVVRKIAPLLRSKATDPAVVVLGQDGRHAISLLSGHLGGANELATTVAEGLSSKGISCEPVITTATDLSSVTAFDIVAKENGLRIEELSPLRRISAAMLEGRPVNLFTDLPIEGRFRGPVHLPGDHHPQAAAQVVISCHTDPSSFARPTTVVNGSSKDQLDPLAKAEDGFENVSPNECGRTCFDPALPTLWLRPPVLHLGVGCRRGLSYDQLREAFDHLMETNGLSPLSICTVSTIDIKLDEAAIHELTRDLLPQDEKGLRAYPAKTLLPWTRGLSALSDFVEKTTGTPAVSAPAALETAFGETGSGAIFAEFDEPEQATVGSPPEKTTIGFPPEQMTVGFPPEQTALRSLEDQQRSEIIHRSLLVEKFAENAATLSLVYKERTVKAC